MNRARRNKLKKILEKLDAITKEIDTLFLEEDIAASNLHPSFVNLACKLGSNCEKLSEAASLTDAASFYLSEIE